MGIAPEVYELLKKRSIPELNAIKRHINELITSKRETMESRVPLDHALTDMASKRGLRMFVTSNRVTNALQLMYDTLIKAESLELVPFIKTFIVASLAYNMAWGTYDDTSGKTMSRTLLFGPILMGVSSALVLRALMEGAVGEDFTDLCNGGIDGYAALQLQL